MKRDTEEDYWKGRWDRGETGWDSTEPNPILLKHLDTIALPGTSVFVPLCGSSVDVYWLRSKGYSVIGCEVVVSAVKALFAKLGIRPAVSSETVDVIDKGVLGSKKAVTKTLTVYSAEDIKIYTCNVFDMPAINVAAIYDRAAMAALPDETRKRYVKKVIEITSRASQLVVVWEHSRPKVPPYSVTAKHIHEYFDDWYDIACTVAHQSQDAMAEVGWVLLPKH